MFNDACTDQSSEWPPSPIRTRSSTYEAHLATTVEMATIYSECNHVLVGRGDALVIVGRFGNCGRTKKKYAGIFWTISSLLNAVCTCVHVRLCLCLSLSLCVCVCVPVCVCVCGKIHGLVLHVLARAVRMPGYLELTGQNLKHLTRPSFLPYHISGDLLLSMYINIYNPLSKLNPNHFTFDTILMR